MCCDLYAVTWDNRNPVMNGYLLSYRGCLARVATLEAIFTFRSMLATPQKDNNTYFLRKYRI